MLDSLRPAAETLHQLVGHLREHFQVEGSEPPSGGETDPSSVTMAEILLRGWSEEIPREATGEFCRVVSKMMWCESRFYQLFHLPVGPRPSVSVRVMSIPTIPAGLMKSLEWCETELRRLDTVPTGLATSKSVAPSPPLKMDVIKPLVIQYLAKQFHFTPRDRKVQLGAGFMQKDVTQYVAEQTGRDRDRISGRVSTAFKSLFPAEGGVEGWELFEVQRRHPTSMRNWFLRVFNLSDYEGCTSGVISLEEGDEVDDSGSGVHRKVHRRSSCELD